MKKTVLLNIALVCNKTSDYRDTLINCTKALDIDANTTKAYYLRAQANSKLA